VLKRGVFGFGSFAGFKWGVPSCLRGPLGLSPTILTWFSANVWQPILASLMSFKKFEVICLSFGYKNWHANFGNEPINSQNF
jgi:hypothetical protein